MAQNFPSKAEVRELVSEHLAELHARDDPEADPLHALDQLHDQLAMAARTYEAGPKQQRQAVCDAIMAVSEFLKGQGFSTATMVPLNRVKWAIVDLCQHNHPDPLFCEKPSNTKPRRDLADAVRQGHLAAIADAWLASASDKEGDESTILDRAARYMSGLHFGALDRAALSSARSYQRKTGQNELVYESYEQMKRALAEEAKVAGGEKRGLRAAILAQLNALNVKAELQLS